MKTMNFEQMQQVHAGWSWSKCAAGAGGSILLNANNIASMAVFGPWWSVATGAGIGLVKGVWRGVSVSQGEAALTLTPLNNRSVPQTFIFDEKNETWKPNN